MKKGVKADVFRFVLKGQTLVLVDWANVYNWKNSLKWQIDSKKLYTYLLSYPEIREMLFYHGTDTNDASRKFIDEVKQVGFSVVTKPVKYLSIQEKGVTILRRKCDFDLEIGLDCFERLEKFQSFIFFSGDGDFATLYKRLVVRKKQVIVVFAQGHLGKEIRQIKQGIYLCVVKKLAEPVSKKYPPTKGRGRD
ncbi:MAG: NYN domain-containing protein [Candidatus Levybacteria bacterium]|nr:NYN domain-containing protein [Candidatus Levybacteria bacterium]